MAASTARASTPMRRKALAAADCTTLEQIPNIGPALAADLRSIGIEHPLQLVDRDAYGLYRTLCERSGRHQDPCVLDTFLAATDFMRGASPLPWWHYTAQRKRVYGPLAPSAVRGRSGGSPPR